MLKYEELPEVNSERWLSLEDLEGEEWKQIPHFPLYEISNYSRIKSHARIDRKLPIIMLTSISRGYYFIELKHESGKLITKGVHRLMAETFLPNSNNYPQVNHKDENKKHNLIDNLEWCTSLYNMNYGTRNARAGIKLRQRKTIPLAQYSLDGKYINSFIGLKSARRILGLYIQKPIDGWKTQFSHSCGYLWRQYEEGVDMTKDIPPYIDTRSAKYAVEQYSVDGTYIATFATIKHASCYIGHSYDYVYKAFNRADKQIGGYKWKFIKFKEVKNLLTFDINGRSVDNTKINN